MDEINRFIRDKQTTATNQERKLKMTSAEINTKTVGKPSMFSQLSLNLSNQTSANGQIVSVCQQETSPPHIAQAVFLIFIIIITLLGNGSVCVTVFLNRSLRTFTNLLVVSLAVSDLMVATLSLPFRVHQTLHNFQWCMSEGFCQFWISADFLCCCASIWNLALISVDRFLATKYPLNYHQMITKRNAVLMVSGVWLLSILVASLGLFNWTDFGGKNAHITNGCVKYDPNFYTFAATAGFFLPLLVVLFAYSYVFYIAMGHTRAIARATVPASRVIEGNTKEKRQALTREIKAAKTLAIVVGVFTICWFPFFVIILVRFWCKPCVEAEENPKLKEFYTFLGITFVYTLPQINSACNPFIYVIFSKKLRLAFVRVFRRFKNRIWDCLGKPERKSNGHRGVNVANASYIGPGIGSVTALDY